MPRGENACREMPVSIQNASFFRRCSSALTSSPNSFVEVAFLHEPIDGAVVDHLVEVEGFHLGRDSRIRLLRHDRLDRGRQHVRHAVEDVAVLVEIVDARHVGFRLLVVGDVAFDRERLVVVEALDGFGVGLDDELGQLGRGRHRLLAEQVDGGRVDVAVGQIRQRLVAGLFEPEVVGRGQQRGVGAAGLERRGAAADVGADRDPLHVRGRRGRRCRAARRCSCTARRRSGRPRCACP